MPEPPEHRERLVGSVEAAQAAHVSVNVISNWRNKGWLDRDGQRKYLPIAGRDYRGLPLYRYGDVLNAERETRRSGKSHRRCPPPQDWVSLNMQTAAL